jgi:hypothetical protein
MLPNNSLHRSDLRERSPFEVFGFFYGGQSLLQGRFAFPTTSMQVQSSAQLAQGCQNILARAVNGTATQEMITAFHSRPNCGLGGSPSRWWLD